MDKEWTDRTREILTRPIFGQNKPAQSGVPTGKKPVVLITGVSSGIGLAAAVKFSKAGWMVVGTVRRRSFPPQLATRAIDVQPAEMTRLADLERLVQRTVQTYGRIDAMVLNAGYGQLGALDTLTHQAFVRQLAVNLVAPADLIRLVLPVMRRQKEGVIVGVSSAAGLVASKNYAAYDASKFGLEGLLEATSHDADRDGVALKLVEPGPVATPFWEHIVAHPKLTQAVQRWADKARGVSAETVAEVIFQAVTDGKGRWRYPVGQARLVWYAKRLLPERLFRLALNRWYIGRPS